MQRLFCDHGTQAVLIRESTDKLKIAKIKGYLVLDLKKDDLSVYTHRTKKYIYKPL